MQFGCKPGSERISGRSGFCHCPYWPRGACTNLALRCRRNAGRRQVGKREAGRNFHVYPSQTVKPSAFRHHRPTDLSAALRLLADYADQEGRVLAGGQTLVAAMALRLARPQHLIDINGIAALDKLAIERDHLHVGACVRHAAFHRPVIDHPTTRLMAAVVGSIAHLPIRNRGTICGSLANADASSEWCLLAMTLDAVMVVASVRGERRIAAEAFFFGYMMTALEPDELLAAVELPLLPADAVFGFAEISRRAGDFAEAMALVCFRVVSGRIRDVRIGIGGVEGRARRLTRAEAAIEGQVPSAALCAFAADAAAEALDPQDGDQGVHRHAQQMIRSVVNRAMSDALFRSGTQH